MSDLAGSANEGRGARERSPGRVKADARVGVVARRAAAITEDG